MLDQEAFESAFAEESRKIGRFNLAVLGKTGVGKSTLINAIFGEDVAPTGIGEPVTMTDHLYLHRSGYLGVVDTRGLEVGVDSDTILEELGTYIAEMRKRPLHEQLHVAWYCVRATDRRFEDVEADFVRRLDQLGLPVILVLTQVPSREGALHTDALELAAHIESLDLPIAGGRVIPVMALADGFMGQVQHGVRDLLDATFRVAPEGVQHALVAAQKVDLALKWKKARVLVNSAVTAAAAVGATPIPIADAAMLVPIQLGMMASVSAVYGVKMETATLAASAATTLATAAGRSTVTGLLKLIPGAGTIIGGAVSATTAAGFTLGIGYAWAGVCAQLTQGKFTGADGVLDNDAIRAYFSGELSRWFDAVVKRKVAIPSQLPDELPSAPELPVASD